MLYVIGSGLLGLVVGSLVSYLLAKRGSVVMTLPNNYLEGFKAGHYWGQRGLIVSYHYKGQEVGSQDRLTHIMVWTPYYYEGEVLGGHHATVSASGIQYEDVKHLGGAA